MEEFYNILKEVNSNLEKLNNGPEKVLINKDWLESQIDEGLIRKEDSFIPGNKIFGIPVEFDETVETYKLVYDDPYEEMKRILERMYGHQLDKFEREMIVSNIRVSESMKDNLYNLTRFKS